MQKPAVQLKVKDDGLIETSLNGKKEELLNLLTTAIIRRPEFRELVSEAMMMVMTSEMEEMIETQSTDLPASKLIVS